MLVTIAALVSLVVWLALLVERRVRRPSPVEGRPQGTNAWGPAFGRPRFRVASASGPAFDGPRGSGGAWLCAFAATLAAAYPLLVALPVLAGPRASARFDAYTHAAVAQAIARGGALHGWIDVYNGGFPFGPHYPPVAWLLVAGLIRLGVPTIQAVQGVGIGATLAVPVLALLAARAAGARPVAACAGALLLTWVSPHNFFVGGWEPFVAQGLLSQAVAMPIVVLLAHALVGPGGQTWPAPVVGALLAATHPQIAVAALAVAAPAVLRASAHVRARWIRAAVACVAVSAALYGPGLRTLGVPFGWPPIEAWRTVGFPPSFLPDWILEGELLDQHRPAVLTAAWVAATFVLVANANRRICFGVLAASLVAVVLSVSGPSMQLFALGRAALAGLQPLRVLAIVPIAAAASVVVAWEIAATFFEARIDEVGVPAWLRKALPAIVPAAVLAVGSAAALPSRASWAEGMSARETWNEEHECGPDTPAGYRTAEVTKWLADLDRGRFAFSFPMERALCPAMHGLELASPVALAGSMGVGAHVGVNAVAFDSLRLDKPGGAARAEALGVRSLLHTRANMPLPSKAWHVVRSSGDVRLSERVGGTDTVGIGCVDRALRGDDASLRKAVMVDLNGEASVIADPTSLVLLETTTGPLVHERVDRKGCDPSVAFVHEKKREPGAYEANVDTLAPIDVVIRASAFPTWRVVVDGAAVPTRMVAPGFVSARLGAGIHHVVAIVSPPAHYREMILAALFVVALCAVPWRARWR